MPPRVGARRANPGLNDTIPLGLAKHHSRLVRNDKPPGRGCAKRAVVMMEITRRVRHALQTRKERFFSPDRPPRSLSLGKRAGVRASLQPRCPDAPACIRGRLAVEQECPRARRPLRQASPSRGAPPSAPGIGCSPAPFQNDASPLAPRIAASCGLGGSAESRVLRQTRSCRQSTARTRHSTVAGIANSAVAEHAWLGTSRL